IESNNWKGIKVEGDNNSFSFNTIQSNNEYGLEFLSSSADNNVTNNYFISNQIPQAVDSGFNNNITFNYWSDWISHPDDDNDNIIDDPYPLGGTSGNNDPCPMKMILIDENSLPVISNVRHSPVYPTPSDIILVKAVITDFAGILAAHLHYQINDGSWYNKTMAFDIATGEFSAELGPFNDSTTVDYYVEAIDGSIYNNKTVNDNDGQYYNFTVLDTAGPLIAAVTTFHRTPSPGEVITINASVTDESGIRNATLYYRINEGSWEFSLMNEYAKNSYSAVLGSFDNSTVIDYYVEAFDNSSSVNRGINDNNDNYFSFTVLENMAPVVTLISPNGGEIHSNYATIKWSASDINGGSLTFTLYYWNASLWEKIAEGLTTTIYTWNINSLPNGTYYKVKVTVFDGEFHSEDISDNTFTIANTSGRINNVPVIKLSYPNGGENLSGVIKVKWVASDLDGDPLTFNLYYWDSVNWVVIATDLVAISHYFDTTSLPNRNDYKIKVTATDGIDIAEDISDNPFAIFNGEGGSQSSSNGHITRGFVSLLVITGFVGYSLLKRKKQESKL
ncbi:MAG: NosD domain-containing protein, partial [Candidatus Odinarchaeota archaeon]